MPSLMDRLQKASTLEYADVLSDSTVYNTKESVQTPIPGLNIAYSSRADGGLSSGLHVWAGPSKHFKSLFCLISAAAYLHQYPDSICIFYDNEFGSPADYFKSVGIDPKRVLHSPFLSLEMLRTDISNQLKEINRGDKVVIVVDSLGMAASEKEIKDAEDGSDKADMTRAKINKSLFRIVTPHLRLKDIPMLVVQHTYEEQKMYGKTIVSGGTGTMLAAENVYILGKQAEREGTDLVGYNFIINVEKSRYVKEKSKIPITVKRTGGVVRWSGLFDIAVEGGFISKTSSKSYALIDAETGEIIKEKLPRKSIENNGEFWKKMLQNTKFNDYIHERYAVSTGDMISDEEIDTQEVEENIED